MKKPFLISHRQGLPIDDFTVRLTVVMPVYNARPYIDEAIESIVTQIYTAFVFAIYDDHSTDGSFERALEWAARDERIAVVRGKKRLGPSASSQKAAELATTEFVARMDADDIAHPERLKLQMEVLNDYLDAVLIGSIPELIDGGGRVIRSAASAGIMSAFPPFAHPGVLYRRTAFVAAGGYDPDTDYFEDFDLFRRMAQHGHLLVNSAPLIKMRFAGQNARWRDDRMKVLRRLNRLYSGKSGDALADSKIAPMAFYSVAVLAVLALERPQLFRLMLKHGRFRPLWPGLAVLTMIAVAEIWPRLAGGIGRTLKFCRDRLGRSQRKTASVYRWNFPSET